MSTVPTSTTFYPSPDLEIKISESQTIKSCNITDIIYDAYSNHYALEFGPDHIWMSILGAFRIYIAKNSIFRGEVFADFKEKETLKFYMDSKETDNLEFQVIKMTESVKETINDPELIDILVPTFSTSTLKVKLAFLILILSTPKKFAGNKGPLYCGLPKVTMHGTVEDYKLIIENVKKLLKYDNVQKHLDAWLPKLITVLEKFVESISGKPDLDWWNACCTYESRGSGPCRISGWLVVFSPYNDKHEYQFNGKFEIMKNGKLIKYDYISIDKDDMCDNIGTIKVEYYLNHVYAYTTTFTGMLLY